MGPLTTCHRHVVCHEHMGYFPANLLASDKPRVAGVGPSSTTCVTRPVTAEGLSTITRASPRFSARVDPVIEGCGWMDLMVEV